MRISKKNCRTCRYCTETEIPITHETLHGPESLYECRRNAPKPLVASPRNIEDEVKHFCYWPHVFLDDFCGEWKGRWW